MEIYDLDNDLPEEKSLSVTVNKIKYVIKMTVSFDLGCYLLSQKDIIVEIFGNGSGKPTLSIKTLQFAYDACRQLLKDHDPETMTDAYLKKHLSVTTVLYILINMAKPFMEFMQGAGAALIGNTKSTDGKKKAAPTLNSDGEDSHVS